MESPRNSGTVRTGVDMSVDIGESLSKEYIIQCLSDITAGATLLKAGRNVSKVQTQVPYA